MGYELEQFISEISLNYKRICLPMSDKWEENRSNIPEFDYKGLWREIEGSREMTEMADDNSMLQRKPADETFDPTEFIKITEDEMKQAKILSKQSQKEHFVDKEGVREYFRKINEYLDQDNQELDLILVKLDEIVNITK
ncbi:hypothetical protein ECANGB1_451 [Enterospora canceri]|uniref:Uncharacterized protein n=1 Tax=Enterospora canceri TaxID=1081671 RepID=A0A1Y1S936_9MICR|nr:hypothetical protein ECANGB1_451 [Enterospora canceri]